MRRRFSSCPQALKRLRCADGRPSSFDEYKSVQLLTSAIALNSLRVRLLSTSLPGAWPRSPVECLSRCCRAPAEARTQYCAIDCARPGLDAADRRVARHGRLRTHSLHTMPPGFVARPATAPAPQTRTDATEWTASFIERPSNKCDLCAEPALPNAPACGKPPSAWQVAHTAACIGNSLRAFSLWLAP